MEICPFLMIIENCDGYCTFLWYNPRHSTELHNQLDTLLETIIVYINYLLQTVHNPCHTG